jgi:predicted RNase H-like HicB family nuclease
MAGTMPHAIFIEPEVDGPGTFAAYAAELPGCAVFAASGDEAAGRMPQRVNEFTGWLRERGEPVPAFVGDNWYEVERVPASSDGADGRRRAAFSLDELSPSDEEFGRWMRWLELSREELADALDAAGGQLPASAAELTAQDLSLAQQLGADAAELAGDDPVDRLYAARDLLTDALAAAGPTRDGVRRALRLAIADDLRLAAELRGSSG